MDRSCPILEEDIAMANLAQDELGHATVWYELIQQLTGEEPNQLVFFSGTKSVPKCANGGVAEGGLGVYAYPSISV